MNPKHSLQVLHPTAVKFLDINLTGVHSFC